MANPPDPFLEVQGDVQTLLTQTRHTYSSYLRIRSLNPSHTSPEHLQSRSELLSNLSTLRTDLTDLLATITSADHDPHRFGLDLSELQRRRTFVQNVSAEVESMGKEISSSTPSTNHLPDPSDFDHHHHNNNDEEDDDNNPYAAFEAQQQQTIFQEQDTQIDEITHTVGRLRGQAADMGRELEEQVGILDEVDTVADRVGGKLQGGLKRVGEIVRRNEDRWSGCCIGVLIFVLILLLVLLIII